MSTPIEAEDDGVDPLERAAELALELRKMAAGLRDPALKAMIDVILLNIGRKIAERDMTH